MVILGISDGYFDNGAASSFASPAFNDPDLDPIRAATVRRVLELARTAALSAVAHFQACCHHL